MQNTQKEHEPVVTYSVYLDERHTQMLNDVIIFKQIKNYLKLTGNVLQWEQL